MEREAKAGRRGLFALFRQGQQSTWATKNSNQRLAELEQALKDLDLQVGWREYFSKPIY
jgi:hypothetical protein